MSAVCLDVLAIGPSFASVRIPYQRSVQSLALGVDMSFFCDVVGHLFQNIQLFSPILRCELVSASDALGQEYHRILCPSLQIVVDARQSGEQLGGELRHIAATRMRQRFDVASEANRLHGHVLADAAAHGIEQLARKGWHKQVITSATYAHMKLTYKQDAESLLAMGAPRSMKHGCPRQAIASPSTPSRVPRDIDASQQNPLTRDSE